METQSVNMKETFKLLSDYLKFQKKEWRVFLVYGLVNTLLLLLTPLAVQMVVNQIAISGLKISLTTLIIIIAIALTFAQLIKFAQFIILEYIQRQFKVWHLPSFIDLTEPKKTCYYFEISSVQKKISSWTFVAFELTLSLFVGLIAMTFYHPFFLAVSLFVLAGLYLVYSKFKKAIATNYDESTAKYEIFYHMISHSYQDEFVEKYFEARDNHFQIVRTQVQILYVTQILSQIFILLGGALLVQNNQLSLGQFVAVELIFSAITASINKAPKFLETHYDLITSLKKIEYATGKSHEV